MRISSSPFSLSPSLFKTSPNYFKSPNPSFFRDSSIKTFTKLNRKNMVQYSRSSSNGRPNPSSGDNDRKVVLDAFFLGKAFAEALNERIGSAVGEALSVVGQWQAEQQKQVLDFQEEVAERAKRAQEKAALEAMGSQSLISRSPMTSQDTTTAPIMPSPRGPQAEDPLQEMLND